MATRRAWALLLIALVLYILANQTQVGWTYIMSNVLIGLVLVTFVYGLGMLKPIEIWPVVHNLSPRPAQTTLPFAQREQAQAPDHSQLDQLAWQSAEFYEDDPVEVTLQFNHKGLRPAFLVGGQAYCPFAPEAEQTQTFFVPTLFKGRSIRLSYHTCCHRRGNYQFPGLRLHTPGPFGLFGTRRTLEASGEILIYPNYFPLNRMRLLETRGFADKQALRVGASSEVVGTREYRSGDSLRQIHWRSTARVSKLVVKEFLDTDQLTMTVVLDLSKQGNVGAGKFSTFETAVRLAASFGYYAARQNIPFHLAGQSQRWRPPATALSWWGILNYLAKVENDGRDSLAEVLSNLPVQPFVVVLVSKPDEAIERELVSLQHKGIQMLAVFITLDGSAPASFLSQSGPGLERRQVDSHNWPAVFDDV
jgi:hypothetical protein